MGAAALPQSVARKLASMARRSNVFRAMPSIIAITVMASACANELTPETATASPIHSPLGTPIATGSPSPSPGESPISQGPAIHGLRLEDVVAGWQDFGLTCEDGLSPAGPDPSDGLIGAQCKSQDLLVLINHWSDGGVLMMDVISLSPDPSSEISSSSREALLLHVAAIEYEGSDPDVAEKWLLANRRDECGQGCYLIIGAASWFHAVGSRNADQVSLGPAH